MAEVDGEALVPSFIVPNQILQTLKKCLLYTLGHLAGEKQQTDRKGKEHKQSLSKSQRVTESLGFEFILFEFNHEGNLFYVTQSILSFFNRVNTNAGIKGQQTSSSVWNLDMENNMSVLICVHGLTSEENHVEQRGGLIGSKAQCQLLSHTSSETHQKAAV